MGLYMWVARSAMGRYRAILPEIKNMDIMELISNLNLDFFETIGINYFNKHGTTSY